MLRNKQGQSIIEYSIIAILVVLGVVVMGPYVLRSVNGHFKMWDDQVQDTFNDRLKQVPAEQVDLPPNCTPVSSTLVAGSCGVKGKTKTCKDTERYFYGLYNPPGCYILEECRPDNDDTPVDGNPTCCTPAIRSSCGNLPLCTTNAQGNCTDTFITPASRTSTGRTYQGATVYEAVSNTCYFGERQIKHRCGTGSDTILGCIVDTITTDDDPSCSALCTGALPVHAALCPNTTVNVPTNTPLRASGTGPGTCPTAKCRFYCEAPYYPNASNTLCQIAVPYTVAGNGETDHKQWCYAGEIVVAATSLGAGCGNPGILDTNCTATITVSGP